LIYNNIYIYYYSDLSRNKIDDVLPESLNELQKLSLILLSNNVNIKGKSLTNPSLTYCRYTEFNQVVDEFCFEKHL